MKISVFQLLLLAAFLSAGGCTKFDVLNSTVPAFGYARTRDIGYGQTPRQRLDVYRPCGVDRGAPVVVFFYGGYWQFGSKGDYRFMAQALAARGYVVVIPDYRLYPEVVFPAFVEDGAAAVRWTRDNIARFGGDASRVFLMGHSAGAHTAAMLALDEHFLRDAGVPRDYVRGAVVMSGPVDFKPGPDFRPIFGIDRADESAHPNVNPVHFARGDAPPILLQHGLRDDVVNVKDSDGLYRALKAAGSEVEIVHYPKLGHPGVALAMAWDFQWIAPVMCDADRFMRSKMERAAATGR